MSTALVHIEQLTAVEIFRPGAIDPILEQIEQEARREASQLDISTEGNRKALASLAFKVAKSKTFVESQRKALVTDEKKRLAKIDEEGRRIWNRFEALQEEIRKPLTDWENAEKSRVACHEEALRILRNLSMIPQPFGVTEVNESIENVESLFNQRNWEEFAKRAADTRAAVLFELNAILASAQKAQAEALEAERLRAEAQERAIKEREAAAAKAAKEEAERKAAERARIAQEAAERERQRIERERIEAEARVKEAEARRIREAEEAERRLEAEKQAAKRREEEAAAKAKRDQEVAIERERQRIAEEAKREADAQARREANKKHREKVNGAAADAFISFGFTSNQAQNLVQLIADGKIPGVTIAY